MFRPLIFSLLFFSLAATAQETLNPLREMEVPYAPEGLLLDGLLGEGEYEGALKFELFREMDPEPNGTPPVLSKGYIYRTQDALIVGFDCPLVDSTHLRANVQPRDQAWGDDFIGITMDLFGDMRNTVFIASNAHGVQIDLRNNNPTIEDDSQYDVGYDVTYDSYTHIGSRGWTLEMRIPFSSLQFENQELQRWRVGFFREYYVGAQVHRAVSMNRNFNNPCFDCQFNDFLLLENVQSSVRRDLLPYVLGGVPFNGVSAGSPTGQIGLSAFYGINSQNSIELALNPDFSTVESDVAQVDVNSATSLFYPERRPFFNEGADLTQTSMNLFYSRTIASPAGMMKYLGQGKKLRTYALAGYDLGSPYLVPGENRDVIGQAGQSFASVVRFTAPRKDGENIGLLSTNRVYLDGGSGHMNALTVRENLGESWRFSAEYAWSYTNEPETDWITSTEKFGEHTVATDGEQFHGFAASQSLQRSTMHWVTDLYWQHTDRNFRADMGYVPINNRSNFGTRQRYIGRPNGKYLKFYSINAGADGSITPQGLWKNQSATSEVNFQFAYNFSIGGGVANVFMEEFEGVVLNNLTGTWAYVGWSPDQRFRINSYVNPGEFVAYNAGQPRIGNGFNSGTTITLQLAGKLQMSFNGNYSSLWETDGSGFIYNGWIWRSEMRYNANRFLQARLITQWNEFSDQFVFQPLIQYQPSPFTIFYIGSNTGVHVGDQGQSQIFAKAQVTLRPFKS